MTSRRDFLQATAVLSAAMPLSIRAGSPAGRPLALSSALIDERHAAAREFGARVQRAGIALRTIKGDVTDFWLDDLHPQWTRKPAPIAGLTARPALFCLEQLARDYRLRVVYHAEHKVQPDGSRSHTVHLPARGLSAAELTAAGAAWPDYAADAISRLTAARSPCGPSSACLEAAVGDDQITLHSWVIAS
ncbi:MAG: hypothetical protein RL030_207 [Pseudomonadota bacterium]|jgi:hypothetical protein